LAKGNYKNMDIEIGEAYRKPNGNIVKVTLNEFREIFYLHIREYASRW
jgi:hypothetical protein